jgi:hypothetical protein
MIAFHAWRLGRGEHDPDALGAEHFVEHRREFGVAVTDQEFEAACVVAQVEHQVAGLLGDPCAGRARGHTQDLDAAAGVLDDGEAVQPGQGDRVGVEEITGEDPFGLGPQELAPVRSGPARDRVDAGRVQDPPDRRRADLPAQARSHPAET